MNSINKLETMLAQWYKGMPHLPEKGRVWLARNVWWIALVGAVISSIGIVLVFMAAFVLGVFSAAYAGPLYFAFAGAGLGLIVAFVVLAISIVSLVVTVMAIAPLKAMRQWGWTLLFITLLIQVASQLFDFIFTLNLFSLIWSLLLTAISGYFLFEIRSYFDGKKPAKS